MVLYIWCVLLVKMILILHAHSLSISSNVVWQYMVYPKFVQKKGGLHAGKKSTDMHLFSTQVCLYSACW